MHSRSSLRTTGECKRRSTVRFYPCIRCKLASGFKVWMPLKMDLYSKLPKKPDPPIMSPRRAAIRERLNTINELYFKDSETQFDSGSAGLKQQGSKRSISFVLHKSSPDPHIHNLLHGSDKKVADLNNNRFE